MEAKGVRQRVVTSDSGECVDLEPLDHAQDVLGEVEGALAYAAERGMGPMAAGRSDAEIGTGPASGKSDTKQKASATRSPAKQTKEQTR